MEDFDKYSIFVSDINDINIKGYTEPTDAQVNKWYNNNSKIGQE